MNQIVTDYQISNILDIYLDNSGFNLKKTTFLMEKEN